MSGATASDDESLETGTRRRYDSPLRRQRAAETRERIVAAGAELVRGYTTWNWDDLTFAAVAERAGVGERTVYRHFPTERLLHDGVMQRLEDEAGVRYEGIGVRDVAGVAERVYSSLGSFSFALQPHSLQDPSLQAEDDRRRRALRAAVDREVGAWPAAERERAAAALDVLWSIESYSRLVGQWSLDPEEAVRVVTWLLELVVDAMERGEGPRGGRRRSAQAKRSPKRSR